MDDEVVHNAFPFHFCTPRAKDLHTSIHIIEKGKQQEDLNF